jgi:carbon storage regulator
MLVLRRKAGEAIILNGSITIHVLAVEGERVKLGISAPPEVVIVRSELLDGAGSGMSHPGMSHPGASHPSASHPGIMPAMPGISHHREPHPYREAETSHPAIPAPVEDLPPRREPGVYPGPSRYSARRRAFHSDGPAPAPLTNSPLRYR